MRGSALVCVVGIPFGEDGLEGEKGVYQRNAALFSFQRSEEGFDRVSF